ncbi:hypothetical protein KCP76_02735 [Salmonella enterica subsp. enterica serovar Weltevreden]|nr:hypothetical protein KCP76_02735 [Salmonella enterica subsp. enterica serovar Weltevreden]
MGVWPVFKSNQQALAAVILSTLRAIQGAALDILDAFDYLIRTARMPFHLMLNGGVEITVIIRNNRPWQAN